MGNQAFCILLLATAAYPDWRIAGPGSGPVANFHVEGGYILACTPYGFQRSVDEGATWSHYPLPAGAVAGLAILGSEAFTVTSGASTSGGLMRSGDSGTTWTRLPPPAGTTSWNFNASSRILALGPHLVTFGYNALYRSSDRGVTWTRANVPAGGNWVPECLAEAGGYLYAGTPNGILRSVDSGATWILAGAVPGPAGKSVRHLAGNDTALIAEKDTWFYRSTDRGVTWTAITGMSAANNSLARLGSDIYFTLEDSLVRSGDGGLTWGFTGVVGHPIFKLAADGGALYAGTLNGGLFRSRDGGARWQRLPVPGGVVQTLYDDGGTLFTAFREDPRLYRTADQGATWMPLFKWVGNTAYPTPPADRLAGTGTTLFAVVSAQGEVRKSRDRGAQWQLFTDRAFIGMRRVGDILFGQGVPAAGSPVTELYRSGDGGSTWELAGNTPLLPSAVLGSVLFADSAGWVRRSRDGGATWRPGTEFMGRVHDIAVCGRDVFSASDSGLFRSADSGGTWQRLGPNLPHIPVLQTYDSHLFAGASLSTWPTVSHGVLLSQDRGNTWTPVTGNLPKLSVNALAVSGSDLWVGLIGGGHWRRPLAEMLLSTPIARDAGRMPATPPGARQGGLAFDATGRRTPGTGRNPPAGRTPVFSRPPHGSEPAGPPAAKTRTAGKN